MILLTLFNWLLLLRIQTFNQVDIPRFLIDHFTGSTIIII